jgi:hypothetical protein
MKKGLLVTVSLSLSILFVGILALALGAGAAQASFERDAASNNVVELSPGTTQKADPGDMINYTHLVTNTDDITHTFEVTVSAPPGWPVDLVTDQWPTGTAHLPFSLGPALTKTFDISLTVPSMIPSGDFETVITVTGVSTDTLAVATDTTNVNQIADVKLSTAEGQSGLIPGEVKVVTYVHTLTNTGEITDIFDLEATSSQGWPVKLFGGNYPTGTPGTVQFDQLTAGATRTFTVSITVPSTAASGSVDRTIITATSNFDSNARDTVTDTTTLMSYVYLPLVLRNYPPIPEGSIEIIADKDYVYQPTVPLSLTATVEGDAVEQMCISNGLVCNEWVTFTQRIEWELDKSDSSLKTVYAQFKGGKGGISGIVSDHIFLMLNGNFESGTFGKWEHGGTLNQFINNDFPHEGSYSALLGDPSYDNENVPEGSAWVYQTIEVPNSSTPTLSFWYRIFTYDVMWSEYHKSYYDYLDVYIQDTNGQTLEHILRDGYGGEWESGKLQDLGWKQFTYDLSKYAGDTIRIHFANFNTGGTTNDPELNTYTYLDEVSIAGSPSANSEY